MQKNTQYRLYCMEKVIAKMKSKNFELCNIFLIAYNINNKEIHVTFNERITKSIIQRKDIAATDTLVKEFKMGGCQIITDKDKSFKKENTLYHRNWEYNTPDVVEIFILLELLAVLEKRTTYH